MHFNFNFVLISILFASAVLADGDDGHSLPQLLDAVEKRTTDASSDDPIHSNWSGAVIYTNNPTFQSITGTFQVPQLTGKNSSSVGVMVGIDGAAVKPCKTFLVAGVECILVSGKTSCTAIAQLAPDPPKIFSDITASPGKVLRVSVTVSNVTRGYVTIENGRESQMMELISSVGLCQLTAEWFVSSIANHELGNFGSVKLANVTAYSSVKQQYHPNQAGLYVIQKNGVTVTSVQTSEQSVLVDYTGV